MAYYLDYAASTPLLFPVKQKLIQTLLLYANPSSLHNLGQQAYQLIQQAKTQICGVLNTNPSELYFTSGATMSNNIAIQGFLKKHSMAHVITSSIEHDDIYLMLQDYPKDLKHFISCDKNGKLNIVELEELLIKLIDETVLLSIQWANNEMGVIQDMYQIAKLANNHPHCILHTDATQYIPAYNFTPEEIGIDMFSCSAQKIGGLKGTGLLYVNNGIQLSPIIYGDQGLIGGTENVPGIVCIGEAFKHLDYLIVKEIKNKRDYLYNKLKNIGKLVGSMIDRLPNNLCMIFEGIKGEEIQALLSDMDIYVSTGSACSSHTDQPSRTLTAMGYTKEEANSSIRFSLGNDLTYEDLDYISERIKFCIEILRNK